MRIRFPSSALPRVRLAILRLDAANRPPFVGIAAVIDTHPMASIPSDPLHAGEPLNAGPPDAAERRRDVEEVPLSTPLRLRVMLPLLLAASTAGAQQPPSLPSSIVSSTSTLSAKDSQTVAAYASAWSEVLKSGEPRDVNRARAELVGPARSPSATPIFVNAYSGAVLGAVAPVAAGEDDFRSINALQVIRFLRTPEAVDAILSHADPQTESSASIRLVAAGLLGAAISDAAMNPAQLDGVTRRVASLAAVEADWMTLLQFMEALDAIAGLKGLPAPSVELARRSQVATLESTLRRATSEGGDPRLAEALYRGLLELRNQMLRLGASQRATFASQFGPVFASIETTTKSAASAAGVSPEAKASLERTATLAQQLAGLSKS